MNKQAQAICNYMGQLADDARELVAATTDVAEEKVSEARDRLAASLEHSKEIYDCVRKREIEGAKAADELMREHTYEAIAIGMGVGVIIGYLIANRFRCNRD